MKYLSTTLPSETYFLINGDKSPLKELLKFTFMDLLLKKVLKVDEVEHQPHKKDPVQIYRYVTVGKNFTTFTPQPHEAVFLSIYQKNQESRVLFRHLVKMGYENAKTQERYHVKLVKSTNLEGAFSRTFLQWIMGGASYTAKGDELAKALSRELAELNESFPIYLKEDKTKALEVLKVIGGNVFLLENIDFALLKEIDKNIIELEEERTYDNGGIGCAACGIWYTDWDDYSHTFDNSCSSDSGCSSIGGDSGCSSCGGCGGCGGCS